ncbi:MAG: SRPBCC family protein [Myxococcota bacterium]
MLVTHHYTVPAPPDVALAVHRDEAAQYGGRFPGVASVSIDPPRCTPDGLHISQHWRGDRSIIPAPLRPLIATEGFRWRIDTCWEGSACDWRLTVPGLGPSPLIQGRYVFLPAPGGTRVSLCAELLFSPDTVRRHLGVARWQMWLLQVVEQFVRMLFSAVLEHSAQVICAHLVNKTAAA